MDMYLVMSQYQRHFRYHLDTDKVVDMLKNNKKKLVFVKSKILKQVEYESARRKRHISEKTRKRDEEGSTFFYLHLSRELEGTRGNSMELKGTRGNSRELKGTQGKRS